LELIDHEGRLWSDRDPGLARALSTRLTGDALTRYGVLNLGYVSIACARRFIRIACRPAILAPPTAVALLRFVHDHEAATIGLDYFTSDWNHLIVRDRRQFRNLLAGLLSPEPLTDDTPRLLRKKITGSASPHRAKVSAARRIFAASPALDEVGPPLDTLFGGRWSVHEVNHETGQTIVRGIGRSYTPYNPAWLASAVGSTLCSYADQDYGLWVADHHREALSAGQPLFDEIDALLSFPGIGNARVCYSRLTLPVTVRDAPRLVLSAAASDSSIDLRRPFLQKSG
jgi:hypothetical protein